MAIGLTLGAAALSYTRFELWFLRLKARFTVVPSGEKVDADLTPAPAPASPLLP